MTLSTLERPVDADYTVRTIAADEQNVLGAILGQAFSEDPIACWSLKTPSAITATYTMLCRQVYFPRGTCLLAGGPAGAVGGAMWLGPGGRKDLPFATQISHGATLFQQSGVLAIRRALALNAVMDQHRPGDPHFYLFALGVLPHGRGRGIARALLTAMTDMADQERLPCWLENSNPRNESLYRGMDFVPIHTFAPAPGCPPMTTMRREPR